MVYWPLKKPNTDFTPPRVIVKFIDQFTSFFDKKFEKSRVLYWLWQFSKGEVETGFTSKKYIFQCTIFQMSVLLLFNDEDILSYEQIATAIGLNDTYMRRALFSLIKMKVLHKAPKNERTINHNSRFKLNKKFTSQRKRVQLNIPIKEETEEGREDDEKQKKSLMEYRKLQIQAAIIRSMKKLSSGKSITYQNLTNDVTNQVKDYFTPDIPVIKKCIDMLIEKEYIGRVEGKKDNLVYL